MKKLRVGIIGTGKLAGLHVKAYCSNPDVEVVAVCDINGERAKQFAAELGINTVYSDYRDMVASDQLDAVSIVTWNNTHAPIAIAALEAGKHVLCEKPPALNAEEALKMLEASKRSNKLLMFGFIKRFARISQFMKEYIDSGELGEIYYAKAGYLRRCGNPGGWFANKSLSGGGPIIDIGIHVMDLCMYLMGKPKPVAVFGNTYDRIGNRSNIKGYSWYKATDYSRNLVGVEDSANALIKFDNGASLYIETSWTLNIAKDTVYSQIYGDKGGADIEPDFNIYTEKNDYLVNCKPILDSYTFEFDECFAAQINHFVDCIINGSVCICPAEDGVTIMKVIDAIYESARTGDIVKLN
ncbi:MAG TPA: Gfo/Idh/MocA family oxidoreductase [Clostridiales bacterium]|nr:Gfo/Idh/MocA family oxidoreductase [Clostridiales bacterium]